MSAREHRSIGEVLSLLQEDYPDVSISKIRFLENQGLISPERTPSGYRKFYDADVDLLRWILHQQRENYYPLKVIKDMISAGAAGVAPCIKDHVDAAPAAQSPPEELPARHIGGGSGPGQLPIADLIEAPAAGSGTATDRDPSDQAEPRSPAESAATTGAGSGERPTAAVPPPPPANVGPVDNEVLTLDEVARAAGLSIEQVREVEKFGLISPLAGAGGDPLYARSALDVARVVAAFRSAGIEPRHLRTYKTAADREAGLLMQAAVTVQRQTNGAGAARELTGDLAALGRRLHEVLLVEGLPPDLRPD